MDLDRVSSRGSVKEADFKERIVFQERSKFWMKNWLSMTKVKIYLLSMAKTKLDEGSGERKSLAKNELVGKWVFSTHGKEIIF